MTSTREAHRRADSHADVEASGRGMSPRRQATRERLMDAAVELFGERGVLGASVEEICERAGFTRGAFYSNFESKDELCLDVLRRTCEQLIEAMKTAIEVIPHQHDGAMLTEELIRDAVAVFLEAQPKEVAEQVAMMELRLHAVRTPNCGPAGWRCTRASPRASPGCSRSPCSGSAHGCRCPQRRWSNCSARCTRTRW